MLRVGQVIGYLVHQRTHVVTVHHRQSHQVVLLLPSQLLPCGAVGGDAHQVAADGPVDKCVYLIKQGVRTLKRSYLRGIGRSMQPLQFQQFHALCRLYLHIAKARIGEQRLPRFTVLVATKGIFPLIARHTLLMDLPVLQHLGGTQDDATVARATHFQTHNA